jgi:hypothetical protein
MIEKSADYLLCAMVDMAVKRHVAPSGLSASRTDGYSAYCMYCGDTAKTPEKVQHKHMCIVAQAQDYLKSRKK